MLNSALGNVTRTTRDLTRVLATEVPRFSAGVAREAAWVTAHLLMYPLGLRPESDRARVRTRARHDLDGLSPRQRGMVHQGADRGATPILLVHGIVDNHSIFTVLDRSLRREGFSDVSSFDYSLLTRDVRQTAEDLADAVERLCGESGYERIHVVGHSLGGLISRYYVQRLGGDARVDTLVTLGTPHAGTVWARAGRVIPLIDQLRPESDVITELAEPAPACRTRFVAFHSDLDHLIVPSRNARIEHPDLDAQNVAVRRVGHLSMPHNRRIAGEIAAALSRVAPERAPAGAGSR